MRRQDVVLAPARDQRARALREARRTGVLSLPARNLSAFPTEVYHLEDHMDKDEKKWECVDLVKIDLSHNAIPSIADDIAALTTVVSIKLCQNALTELPDGFFELSTLTYLDLSHNHLQRDLSERIGALSQLTELALAANKLTRLPQAISSLTRLEVLRAEQNALTALPERIGDLTRLHTLTAFANDLTSLPTSFRGLSNLQTLDLKKNRLTTVSDALTGLDKLKFVDVRQNRLAVFPVLPVNAPALDQVFLGYNALTSVCEDSLQRVAKSLTVLDLRDNKLSALPAAIATLAKLKTLDVANNDLSDLPPGLGYLKHLNHIGVDGNPLRTIRRGVVSAGCEALKKYLRTRGRPPAGVDAIEEEVDELQLHHERLARSRAGDNSGPSSNDTSELAFVYRDAVASGTLDLSDRCDRQIVSELASPRLGFGATLLHLTLSKNRLTELPSQIGDLTALVTLTAEENALERIDVAIAALPHLQRLRVRKNQLSHTAIDALLSSGQCAASTSLKELDLRNNTLTQLPMTLRRLAALETLQLSFNRIETLASFPWVELASVRVVSISDNRLRSLGTIYDAPLLASLSVENNSLATVPLELGLCPFLTALYVNGNPQRTVRGAVIAKGSAAVLAYLKNKCPLDAVLPAPVTMVGGRRDDESSEQLRPSSAVKTTGMLVAAPTVRTTADPSKRLASAGPRSSATSSSDDDAAAIRTSLVALTDAIAALELELENHALSAPKRFALKKELAVLRSTRIREERKLKC